MPREGGFGKHTRQPTCGLFAPHSPGPGMSQRNRSWYRLIHCSKALTSPGDGGQTHIPSPAFSSLCAIPGFPGWLSSKESACQCRRRGFKRSPGGGNGNPLQSSYLGNPTDRGAWLATVHRIAKESDTTEQLDSNRQPPPPQRCVSSGSVLRGYGD